jgi:hypothetical protein
MTFVDDAVDFFDIKYLGKEARNKTNLYGEKRKSTTAKI